ncbi:hypothetical protein SteCoe_28994 [Stentor coeruleus]|uniref:Uncharacterized protein n=1 Tax=Stentor coeruleus TaxID=5963 RepID=A0A1R2B6Z6_9CILI|nr:hypothetical protein SteCoe_28994 [Stentor coeruleus]
MINYDDYVISYNKQATVALKYKQIDVAYDLLSKAQYILKHKFISNLPKLIGLTYNNLGCFYKRSGDYQKALKYLQKSLVQGAETNPDYIHQAGTYLNLCTVYSIMSCHEKALSNALQALAVLKYADKSSESYIFTLIMAYYSVGLEYENVSDYRKALEIYKKAQRLALQILGESHALSIKIEDRMQMLKEKQNINNAKPAIRSFSIKIEDRMQMLKEKQNINNAKPAIRSFLNSKESKKISYSFTPKKFKPKKQTLKPNLTPINNRIFKSSKAKKNTLESYKYNSDRSLYVEQRKKEKLKSLNMMIMANTSNSQNHKLKRNDRTAVPLYLKQEINKQSLRLKSRTPDIQPVPSKRKLSLFKDNNESYAESYSNLLNNSQ